jgi:hypothetical protein
MEGKLIKTEDGYNLVTEQPQGRLLEATCSPSQEKKLFKSGATAKKLSLKNCEAIANGYDLDELCEKSFKLNFPSNINRSHLFDKGFFEGALTILEILDDKKFSEEDISKAINFGVHVEAGNIDIDYKRYGTTENQFIQSLQQTEWDVEIEMNIIPELLKGSYPEEKLDENGCLILKRKL